MQTTKTVVALGARPRLYLFLAWGLSLTQLFFGHFRWWKSILICGGIYWPDDDVLVSHAGGAWAQLTTFRWRDRVCLLGLQKEGVSGPCLVHQHGLSLGRLWQSCVLVQRVLAEARLRNIRLVLLFYNDRNLGVLPPLHRRFKHALEFGWPLVCGRISVVCHLLIESRLLFETLRLAVDSVPHQSVDVVFPAAQIIFGFAW